MPKFVFELDDDWQCRDCPYCQDHEGCGFYECEYEFYVPHDECNIRVDESSRYPDVEAYEKHPEWCPLVPLKVDSYSVSYEGNRDDMWYEHGSNFSLLDDAKTWIALKKSENKWHDTNWHAFEVAGWSEINLGVVYEEN